MKNRFFTGQTLFQQLYHMRKLFAKIHLWLSIPLGIFISIICFTGAILVFEQEITQALNPNLYRVNVVSGNTPLSPSQLADAISRQVPDSLQLTSLQFAQDPKKPVWASFKNAGRKTLSVNPYTGEVNGWSKSYPFFQEVRKLHRWLLDAPAKKGEKSVGKVIIGITTLLMVVILISGLVIWIPRTSKALKNRLCISCTKGWRRFWYDSHVATGIYTLVFLLIMALTGLTWSFGWYRTAAYSLFGATPQATESEHGSTGKPHNMASASQRSHQNPGRQTDIDHRTSPHRKDTGKSENHPKGQQRLYRTWDQVLANLQQTYPVYTSIKLKQGSAQIVTSPEGSLRKSDTARFQNEDGVITGITTSGQAPASQKMKGYFYSFHTGTWGGIWTKILYCLAAFLGGILPLSGYYLWYKKKKGSPSRRNIR